MALKKKPVTGMKDILPQEMQIRDYVISVIKETYGRFGFTSIETPCLEDIGNLSSKQGGENEKLIFKVLKRGEKLNLETAKTDMDVVDMGLRYDRRFRWYVIIRTMPTIFRLHLRHCRWEMYGEQTVHSVDAIASLCSVI